jgi:endonuclease/exonuclease/phosphatase family metal-dependent hydrolase
MARKQNLILKVIGWILQPMALIGLVTLIISYLSPFIHPKTIWWIPLFGLAFPLIFWFNVVTLILLFLFRKKKIKWVLLIVLLIGLPLNTRYFAIGGAKNEKADQTNINIMSYNVRLFDKYKWIGDELFSPKDSILAYIQQQKPAILCLQEYLKDLSNNPYIKPEDISKSNNYNYVHERTVQEQRHLQFGLATFSKYPIVNKGNVFNEQEQDQFCIFSDIKIGEDTIRIYNMHLQSIRFQKEDYQAVTSEDHKVEKRYVRLKNMLKKVRAAYGPRVEQTQKIIEHILQSPYPVVAVGDFNDTPLSYVYNMFNKILDDSYRKSSFGVGRTYAGRIPAGRIDYIFISPEFRSIEFHIQKEVFSDHFAITTKLELGKFD